MAGLYIYHHRPWKASSLNLNLAHSTVFGKQKWVFAFFFLLWSAIARNHNRIAILQ